MRLMSKEYDEELEVIEIYVRPGLTIVFECFKVPEGYKTIASLRYVDLEEIGAHQNKKESIMIAYRKLRNLL